MSKNIYDLLNETNVDLDEYKEQDFTDFEKIKIKKKFRKNINKHKYNKKIIVALFVVVIGIGVMGTDIGVYAKEKLQEMAYDISKALGISTDLDEYKNVINKTVSKNGLEVKLNEVILNNDEIVFSTITKRAKNDESEVISISLRNISINGKELSAFGGGGIEQVDDYTSEQVMSMTLFGLDEKELKGNVDIKIIFDEAYCENDEVIKGPWIFKFRADGSELALKTDEVLLNESFTLENGENLEIKKYTSNDLGQKIYMTTDIKGEGYDIYVKGHDELGNEVSFSMGNCSMNEPILSMDNYGGKYNAKELKLKIYAASLKDEAFPSSSKYKQVGEEFTIDLNN